MVFNIISSQSAKFLIEPKKFSVDRSLFLGGGGQVLHHVFATATTDDIEIGFSTSGKMEFVLKDVTEDFCSMFFLHLELKRHHCFNENCI